MPTTPTPGPDAAARGDGAAAAPKVSARAVSLGFDVRGADGARGTVHVLEGFDLDVRAGEFLSILGPSGCGKSSFLNLLAGLVPHGGGTLCVDGRPLAGINRHQGVVFQGYALFPWRTVQHNVEVGLEIRGVPRAERRATAERHLELVGLHGVGERYPHELSGGMKQRVAIARALAYEPDLLLMDEPFAALDAQTREILQGELLRIWEATGKTIVFVTHSLDEAIYLSDRIAVMTQRPGRVRQMLEVDLPRPRTPELRHAEAFVHLRQRAWEVLRDEVSFGTTARAAGREAPPAPVFLESAA